MVKTNFLLDIGYFPTGLAETTISAPINVETLKLDSFTVPNV